MLIQDLEYYHLLYNTFGPITCTVPNKGFLKVLTNNGTGKTIFIKTLLGLLVPWNGIMVNSNQISNDTDTSLDFEKSKISNSQLKKLRIVNAIKRKKVVWILDEPYSFLDLTSVTYIKKNFILQINRRGSIVITDCINDTLLPSLVFNYSIKWL